MAVFAHFSIDVSHTAHASCAAFFFTVHAVDACAQPRNFATRHAGVRPVVLEVQLPAALRGAERLFAIVRGLRAKAGLPWLAAAGTGAVVRCKVNGLGIQEGRSESRRVAAAAEA